MTNSELIEKGNEIYARKVKREIHLEQPYSILDVDVTKELKTDFENLYNEIPENIQADTLENLLVIELKRICKNHSNALNEELSQTIQTPEQVLQEVDIHESDIEKVKIWLIENRESVIKANKNQAEFHSQTRRDPIREGSAELRHISEGIVQQNIDGMKQILNEFFKDFPGVPELLETYLITSDSFLHRSSVRKISKVAYIGCGNVIYMNDTEIQIIPEEFISVFAHEVLGHCLNFILTENSDLPLFIKENDGSMTSAAKESVTQYIENVIFDYLLNKPEATKLLKMNEPFEEIYKRHKDTKILDDYSLKIRRVGYWVLSHTAMDEFDKQNTEIGKYSIDPQFPSRFINVQRNNWNRATKLLLPRQVSELRYILSVAQDIVKTLPVKQIPLAEELMLTGNWSPQGLNDWMRIGLTQKQ